MIYYCCIDEAQDLNKAQYQVLRALCGSEYRNVMMVGDPKQAIFVWMGADPNYLNLFELDFSAKKISMNENFRSSQAVVKAAKILAPEYEVYGQLPIAGSIELIVGEDEQQEAALVLDFIQNLINKGHKDIEGPINLERCALLGRNRYVLSSVEKELNKRKWLYYKQLSTQHESESDIMQDFELLLSILVNPRDRLHLGQLLNRWHIRDDVLSFNNNSYNSLELLAELKKRATNRDKDYVLQALDAMEWTEQDFKFSKAMDYLDKIASDKSQEERVLIMEDIKIWRKHWDTFLRSQPGGYHSLASFLGQVALGTTQQPKQEGLTLLTMHSAKGLEFDVVVIMGMAEGTFPDYRAKGAGLQEEKRNAFVAVTRSKRLIYFSYSKTKIMPWGSVRLQTPSRYLREIGLIV